MIATMMWVHNQLGAITIPTELVPVCALTILGLQAWQLRTIYNLSERVTRLESWLACWKKESDTKTFRR